MRLAWYSSQVEISLTAKLRGMIHTLARPKRLARIELAIVTRQATNEGRRKT